MTGSSQSQSRIAIALAHPGLAVSFLLRWLKRWLTRWRWRAFRLSTRDKKRLNLGCGQQSLDGYINIDIARSPAVDFRVDISDLSFLENNAYEEVRLDAVFEHLWMWGQVDFLNNVHRSLAPGGLLRLNWLPDFRAIVEAWQTDSPGIVGDTFDLYHVYRYTHGDPAPQNAHAQIHKCIFTRESIVELLEQAGFVHVQVENKCYPGETLAINLCVEAMKKSTE